MKIFGLLLIVLTLMGSSTLLAQGKPYENPQYGIRFEYPDNWVMREQQAGSLVTFMTPKEGQKDTFGDNVNVFVQDLGNQRMNLDEYTEFSRAQLKQMVKDFNEQGLQSIRLGGEEAREIIYTGKDTSGKMMKYRQIWTIKDNKVYLLSFAAEDKDFHQYDATVNDMIDSWEFVR